MVVQPRWLRPQQTAPTTALTAEAAEPAEAAVVSAPAPTETDADIRAGVAIPAAIGIPVVAAIVIGRGRIAGAINGPARRAVSVCVLISVVALRYRPKSHEALIGRDGQ